MLGLFFLLIKNEQADGEKGKAVKESEWESDQPPFAQDYWKGDKSPTLGGIKMTSTFSYKSQESKHVYRIF